MNQLNRQTKLIYGLILALFGILTALVGYSFFAPDGYNVLTQRGSSASNLTDVRSFSSADDFRDYLTRSESSNFVTNNGGSSKFLPEAERDLTAPNTASSNGGPTQRVSQTNVQVTGVDEPDILKTDGKNIFFSRELYDFYPLYEAPIPLLQSQTSPSDELLRSGYMPQRSSSDIKVASAFPIENLKVTSTISKQGELLLDKSTLVIFQSNQIDGYDVSDPAAPKEKWHVDLATNSYLLTSRLYQGRL